MAPERLTTAEDHHDGTEEDCRTNVEHERAKQRNAFTEMMSRKKMIKPAIDDRDKPRPKTTISSTGNNYFGRDGLLAYIKEPEHFPKNRVIYSNNEWVLIHDLFPKASVHLLLLPRDPVFYTMHPLYAFQDTAFLESVRSELVNATEVAMSELQRLFGSHSISDRARLDAMELDDPPLPEDLPPGRDWSKDLKIGIHANPSMNHLHIHILSRDMHSESLRHRTHYQSFNTDFFVRMDEMPLSNQDIQERRAKAGVWLREESMKCWRCGRAFGSQFKRLKEHLAGEYQEWQKE